MTAFRVRSAIFSLSAGSSRAGGWPVPSPTPRRDSARRLALAACRSGSSALARARSLASLRSRSRSRGVNVLPGGMGVLVMHPEYTARNASGRSHGCRRLAGRKPASSTAEQGDHDPHRNKDGRDDGDDLGHGAEPGATKAVHASILFTERGMSPAHKSHSGRARDWPIGNLPHGADGRHAGTVAPRRHIASPPRAHPAG